MKVLYIGDRGAGGIANHVNCLAGCLPDGVERYSINVGGDEEFAGKSGHDLREWFQIRRVMKTFKPDVVHFHTCCILMALYVRSQTSNLKLFCSWHTPTSGKMSWKLRIFFWLLGKDCTFLPVSTPTWEGLKKWLPKAKGEVFFNPIRIGGGWEVLKFGASKHLFTVGMVGRNAEVKDWPSFHKVEEKVKEKFRSLEVWRFGTGVGGECLRELAERKVEEWLTGVTRESFDAALKALIEGKTAAGEYRFKREREKNLAFEGAKRFFDEFSRKIIGLSDGRCVYFTPDARSKGRNSGDLSRCWAEYAFHAVSNGGRRLIGKDYNERWYHPHKAANFGRIEGTLQKEQCLVRLRDNAKNDSILFWGDTLAGLSFDVVTRLDEFGNMDANLTEVTFEVGSRGEKKLPRLVPLAEAVRTVVHHQTTAGSYPPDGGNIPNFFHGDKGVAFLNAGEKEVCDGRAAIAQMDLFVMTSKSEELPTTALECFVMGTPICGFVPKGGMSDILSFSKGPVREAFIVERDCDKLSEIVMDLLAHPEERQALIEDGWQIVQHFDAEKNVKGQLMRVYERV